MVDSPRMWLKKKYLECDKNAFLMRERSMLSGNKNPSRTPPTAFVYRLPIRSSLRSVHNNTVGVIWLSRIFSRFISIITIVTITIIMIMLMIIIIIYEKRLFRTHYNVGGCRRTWKWLIFSVHKTAGGHVIEGSKMRTINGRMHA